MLITVCALLAPSRAAAQPGLPLLRTFTTGDVPISGAVWALARGADGALWVGSNRLAAYDGSRWIPIDVPNAYAFRALATEGERLYVGAVGAVGYVEKDSTGLYEFVSLQSELRAAGVDDIRDVWSAHATKEGVVFVTSSQLLRWSKGRFEHWPMSLGNGAHGWLIDGKVHVYSKGTGVVRLDQNGPAVAWTDEALPDRPIVWMSESPMPTPTIVMGTSDGVFRREQTKGWQKLPGLSAGLAGAVSVCAGRLIDGSLAVATFKAGVSIFSSEKSEPTTIGSRQGLPDDSVFALLESTGGGLWVGTGSGLAFLENPRTASLFDRSNGLEKAVPRKALGMGGHEYIATAKGLYSISTTGTVLGETSATGTGQRIPGGPTLAWGGIVWQNEVWLSGFGGIWKREGPELARVHHSPTDVFRLLPLRRYPDALFFAEGYELRVLTPSMHGGWAANDLGVTLRDTPQSLVEGIDGEIWASTLIGGISRFAVERFANGNFVVRLVNQYREGLGLPHPAARPVLVPLGKRLFAFTDTDILRLGPGGFEIDPAFRDYLGVAADRSPLDSARAYWLLRDKRLPADAPPALWLVTDQANDVGITPLHTPVLDRIGRVVDVSALPPSGEPDRGSALWINGTEGLIRLEATRLAAQEAPPSVRLNAVKVSDGESSTRLLSPSGAAPKLEAGTRTVRFAWTTTAGAEAVGLTYQTKLSGVEMNWSTPQREAAREFAGLAAGSYGFEVRAIDAFGRASSIVSYPFAIALPWYRSPRAFVLHTTLALLLMAGIAQWRLARLRRQNERLDALVRARTRELELSNTAKSEFLENISHEIRNPLNGIVGLAALLREEALSPAELAVTRSLKTCALHLRRVAEEVLGFSKLEYGQTPLENEPFRLVALFEEVVGLHHASAARQGVAVRVLWPTHFRDGFQGDAAKLRTIVSNFVSNALKYAPGSPIEISVDTAEEGEELAKKPLGKNDRKFPTAVVTIEVRDHGPGIEPEEQELIFQKFVRGANSQRDQIPGTGLGLATSRALAKKIGARIGVDSTPGMGAVFYVQVPLRRLIFSAESRLNEPEPFEKEEKISPHGGIALVVEDEEYNRIVLSNMVTELGYRTMMASGVRDALTLKERETFGVVFLDWELQDAKGGDIARALHARLGGRTPLLIATTAHDSDEARARCMEAGMDTFLLKPYSLEHLRQAIAEAHIKRLTDKEQKTSPEVSTDNGELNLEALRLYSRGSTERAGHEISDFLAALSQRVEEARTAVATHQADALMRAAHSLGALTGMAGAKRLNSAAKALEKEAAAISDPKAKNLLLLEAVEEEFAALKKRYGSEGS